VKIVPSGKDGVWFVVEETKNESNDGKGKNRPELKRPPKRPPDLF